MGPLTGAQLGCFVFTVSSQKLLRKPSRRDTKTVESRLPPPGGASSPAVASRDDAPPLERDGQHPITFGPHHGPTIRLDTLAGRRRRERRASEIRLISTSESEATRNQLRATAPISSHALSLLHTDVTNIPNGIARTSGDASRAPTALKRAPSTVLRFFPRARTSPYSAQQMYRAHGPFTLFPALTLAARLVAPREALPPRTHHAHFRSQLLLAQRSLARPLQALISSFLRAFYLARATQAPPCQIP